MPGEWERDDERSPGAGPGRAVDWDAEMERLLEEHRRGVTPEGVVHEVPPAPPGTTPVPWATGYEDYRPPRGRTAALRLAAAIIAGAMILGVIGGSLGIFMGAASSPPLLTSVTSVAPSTQSGQERVTFSVVNRSQGPVDTTCTVEVFRHDGLVGAKTVHLAHPLPVNGGAAGSVDLRVGGGPFKGSPADAHVACMSA